VKLAIAALAAAIVALIAGTVWIAARVREETVVSNPYEEGLKVGRKEGGAAATAGACDLGSAPCARPLPGGGEVRLEIGPRPLVTMKELAVRVDLGAGAAEDRPNVSVSFSMPGMNMGENRSRLAPTGPGRFEGKAVLVRCPSGGREWLADVEIAAPGAPARSARFSLTVAE
jgi:nitrogen fixation protein FixH